MCVKSYIGENKNVNVEKDPLLSPSITSEEILKLFPPTRILTGTKDPLHDESLRFTKRLKFYFFLFIKFNFILVILMLMLKQ